MVDTESMAAAKKAYLAYPCSRPAPCPYPLTTSSVIHQYRELEPMGGVVKRMEYYTRNLALEVTAISRLRT
jgi:hypothetical protein